MKKAKNNRLMNAEDFCIWLHGFIEISKKKNFKESEWEIIVEHLGKINSENKFTSWLKGVSSNMKNFNITKPNEKAILSIKEELGKHFEFLPQDKFLQELKDLRSPSHKPLLPFEKDDFKIYC